MINQRFNPDLVRAAIATLAESDQHLAGEVERLLSAATATPTVAITRNEDGDLFTTSDVPARIIFIDESQNFGSFEDGDDDVYQLNGKPIRASIRDADAVDHKDLFEALGLQSGVSYESDQPANPLVIDDMIFVPNAEVRQALIASLFYWRQMGMCESDNRTDGIHAVATGNDEYTSASEEDIDKYLLRLYGEHDPLEHLKALQSGLNHLEQVVVKIKGGMVGEVTASVPVEVMILDADIEGCELDEVVVFDDVGFMPGAKTIATGLNVDPAYCADVRHVLFAYVETSDPENFMIPNQG